MSSPTIPLKLSPRKEILSHFSSREETLEVDIETSSPSSVLNGRKVAIISLVPPILGSLGGANIDSIGALAGAIFGVVYSLFILLSLYIDSTGKTSKPREHLPQNDAEDFLSLPSDPLLPADSPKALSSSIPLPLEDLPETQLPSDPPLPADLAKALSSSIPLPLEDLLETHLPSDPPLPADLAKALSSSIPLPLEDLAETQLPSDPPLPADLPMPPSPIPGSTLSADRPKLGIDRRLFAHLIGDAIIQGTDLEGLSIEQTVKYRIDQLSSFIEKGRITSNQVDVFKRLLSGLFENDPQVQADRVAALKPGESYLIEGGWKPSYLSPGHAMVYEFYRNPDGLYDVLIYNTGAGLQHHQSLSMQGKDKYQRVVCFENVLPEEIGLSLQKSRQNPAFFASLSRFANHRQKGDSSTNADDLYKKAFIHLKDKRCVVDEKFAHFATKQRSGTCAERVVDPITYRHFCKGELSAYKRLMFDIDTAATLEYYKYASKEDEDLQLLKHAAAKQLKAATKLYESNLMDDQEFKIVTATLQDLQQSVAYYEELELYERKHQLDLVPQDLLKAAERQKPGCLKQMPKILSSHPIDLRTIPPSLIDPAERLLPLVKQAEKLAARKTKDSTLIKIQIERFLDCLPLPSKEEIEKIPSEELLEILDSFHHLMELYTCATFTSSYCPQQQNRKLHLLSYIYYLTLRHDLVTYKKGARLHTFNLDLTEFREEIQSPWLIFFRPEDFNRRNELLSLFPSKGSLLFSSIMDLPLKREKVPLRLIEEAEYICSLIDKKNKDNFENLKGQIQRKTEIEDPRVLEIAAALDLNPGQDLLRSSGVGPLLRLRRALVFSKIPAYLSSSGDEGGSNLTTAYMINPLKTTCCLKPKYEATVCESKGVKKAAHSMHRETNITCNYNYYPGLYRQRLPSESEIMMSRTKYGAIIEATNCKPALQPTKLLVWYEDHLTDLLDESKRADLQTLFDLLFFKVVCEPKTTVALFEELPKSQALQRQCASFIKKGIDYFFRLQEKQRPQVECCLFFLRLSMRLRQVHSNIASLPNERAELNKMLECPDLNDEEKSVIHLHRIVWASGQKSLSEDEMQEILASWFFYLQHPLSSKLHDPTLHNQAIRFIYSLSETLENSDPSILNQILPTCCLDREEGDWREIEHPVYANGNWKLNLLTGKISCEEKLIVPGKTSAPTKSAAYKRLFGERMYSSTVIGDARTFLHPTYGRIQLIEESSKALRIRREWKGAWYEYVSPDAIKNMPLPLLAEHSHWSPVQDKSPVDELLIFPLENPSLCIARADKSGAYLLDAKASSEKGKEEEMHDEPIAYFDNWTGMFFDRIERSNCFYFLSDQKEIVFPRFSSLDGQELRFALRGEKWVWTENPLYELKPAQTKGLFGTIPNYLHLINQEGKEKAIIPFLPIQSTKKLDRHICLDINDQRRQEEYSLTGAPNGELSSQKKINSFLEYNIVDGKPVPASLESSLYLAYLFLAQKQYVEAVRLLETIGIHEEFSQKELQILQWIWDLPNLNQDVSGSAIAVRCRAAEMMNTALASPQTREMLFQPIDLTDDLKRYRDLIHHVPPKLRLHLKDNPVDAPQLLQLSPFIEKQTSAVLGLLKSDSLREISSKRELIQPGFVEFRPAIVPKESQVDAPLSIKHYFGFFYEQARLIRTSEEKLHFCTRMHSAFSCVKFKSILDYGNGSYYGEISEQELFQLIHFALLYPDQALPLPPNSSSQDWLDKCLGQYRKVYEERLSPIQFEPLPSIKAPKIKRVAAEAIKPLRMTFGSAAAAPQTLGLPSLSEMERHPLQLAAWSFGVFGLSEADRSPSSRPIHPPMIAAQDLQYKKAINAQFSFWEQEMKAGEARRKERLHYELKNKMPEIEDLEPLIYEQRERVKERVHTIDQLVCKGDTLLEQALLQSGAAAHPDLEELIDLFLTEDPNAYLRVNPHLTKEEIVQLDIAIYQYLVQKTELDQAVRVKEKILDWQKCPERDKKAKAHEVALALKAKIAYTPHQERKMLVLEHRANLRLRENQVVLIRKMLETDPDTKAYRDIVAQLMMGGGKTSIICSMLAAEAKKRGKITVMIAPAAQFDSLRINLSRGQRKHFRQDVVPVRLTRSQMDVCNLKWLNQMLDEVQEKGSILFIKDEDLRGLQCELTAALYTAAHEGVHEYGPLSQKILLLHQILGRLAGVGEENPKSLREAEALVNSFQTGSDALIDEIDAILASMRIVNYPVGAKTPLPPVYIQFMKKIMNLHLSDQLKMKDGTSVRDFLSLRQTRNVQFDIKKYKDEILSEIFHALFKQTDFRLDPALEDSFVRFALGQMEPSKLTEKDRAFMERLAQMGHSNVSADIEAADLISLTAMAAEILPNLINFQIDRTYGRAKQTKEEGKVVVFEAGAPTGYEFGNPLETGFYHFLTAIAQGVSKGQVELWAKGLLKSARDSARRQRIPFEETKEAKEFLQKAHVPLENIDAPEFLERAWKEINANIDSILTVETETIISIVGYYPKFASSTAQNFIQQLQTRRTLSGTPRYRLPTYPASLANATCFDIGVEGEIADQLMKKTPLPTFYQKNDVLSLLSKASEAAEGKQINGIIDAANILKGKSGLEVAREVQKMYPHMDILYFDKRPGEEKNDSFMVLKSGHSEPKYLGGTKPDDLREQGVNLDQAFVFYDERHCEATDILQKSDAMNLLTVDEIMPSRNLFQACLRMRGFFDEQRVILMISEEAAKNKGILNTPDLVWMTQVNEAIIKAKETYRSYQQKFEHIPRQLGIEALLREKPQISSLVKTFLEHEGVLISTQELSPFKQVGYLKEQIDALDALKQKAKKTCITAKCKQAGEELLQEAALNPYLSSKVVVSEATPLGQEMTLQIQLQNQVEVEMNLELDLELQLELHSYDNINRGEEYVETVWDKSLIQASSFPRNTSKVRTLSSLLEEYAPSLFSRFKLFSYAKPYHKIFDKDLLITENLAHTFIHHLPVFNHRQKRADQHLVILKDGKVQLMMLSIADADFFKRYLEEESPENMWLIHANGKEISDHKHCDLAHSEEVELERLLLQVALFNGDARELDAKDRVARDWMNEANRDLKLRFLRLKVEQDSDQKNIFYRYFFTKG